ncbi:hypothetical protein BC828DRAFT_379922 [Blastocladiella britannica]|nr:hypothetical protein BC828DRAFT_379922 [Blastocladiella britannica]
MPCCYAATATAAANGRGCLLPKLPATNIIKTNPSMITIRLALIRSLHAQRYRTVNALRTRAPFTSTTSVLQENQEHLLDLDKDEFLAELRRRDPNTPLILTFCSANGESVMGNSETPSYATTVEKAANILSRLAAFRAEHPAKVYPASASDRFLMSRASTNKHIPEELAVTITSMACPGQPPSDELLFEDSAAFGMDDPVPTLLRHISVPVVPSSVDAVTGGSTADRITWTGAHWDAADPDTQQHPQHK